MSASKKKHKPLTTRGHIKFLAEDITEAAEKLILAYQLDPASFALTISANIQPSICDIMVSNVDGTNSHIANIRLESSFDPFKNENYLTMLKEYLKKSKYGLKTVEQTGRHTYTFTQ